MSVTDPATRTAPAPAARPSPPSPAASASASASAEPSRPPAAAEPSPPPAAAAPRPSGASDAVAAAASAAAQLEPGLDRPVGLIGARLRAAACALLLAVAAGAGWAVFGKLPHTLTLTAVVAHGPAPVTVRADRDGSVLEMRAAPGERVARGQVLAVLRTDAGATSELRATAAGTVTAVNAPAGTPVSAGAPVVALDASDAPVTVRLFAASAADAARLRPGRTVLVPLADGGAARATVTAVDPLPARAATLDGTMPVPLPGLPRGDAAVWTAYARLPAAAPGRDWLPAGPVAVRASVDLGARHPYQAVFGTGAGR